MKTNLISTSFNEDKVPKETEVLAVSVMIVTKQSRSNWEMHNSHLAVSTASSIKAHDHASLIITVTDKFYAKKLLEH